MLRGSTRDIRGGKREWTIFWQVSKLWDQQARRAENRSRCELKRWQSDKAVLCTRPFSVFQSLSPALYTLIPLSHFIPPLFHLYPTPCSFPSSSSSNLPSLLLSSSSSSHATLGAIRAAIVHDIPSLLMVSCVHTERNKQPHLIAGVATHCTHTQLQASISISKHIPYMHTKTHSHPCPQSQTLLNKQTRECTLTHEVTHKVIYLNSFITGKLTLPPATTLKS